MSTKTYCDSCKQELTVEQNLHAAPPFEFMGRPHQPPRDWTIFVHVTAGFGDVGFCGVWTLEMFAVQPVRGYAGIPICQASRLNIK